MTYRHAPKETSWERNITRDLSTLMRRFEAVGLEELLLGVAFRINQ
jgi:hypothetical protein